MNHPPVVEWTEADQPRSARWRSESGAPPPRRIVIADDRTKADDAYKLACEGTALLWRGDFHNARQLLTALARRIDRRPAQGAARRCHPGVPSCTAQAQNHARPHPGHAAGPARRDPRRPAAPRPRRPRGLRPGVRPRRRAAAEAADGTEGPDPTASLVSLRELLGLIGANEWRKKGVEIPALGGDRIHPHYGVFSPARGEYVDLVAEAPLPTDELAFDIGTGTGVLASVLARRGVRGSWPPTRIRGRWPAPARTPDALGVAGQVEVVEADLFPAGRAPLIVCNPPWVPAKPTSPVEHAVYDPGNRMLHGFLNGLADHLTPDGEGWLILSDLAEHLGLRPHAELLDAFAKAGLTVLGRLDITPRHPRARDTSDPLHVARAAEVTSLWRLGLADRAASSPVGHAPPVRPRGPSPEGTLLGAAPPVLPYL